MKYLGIDYGTKRIGLAISDSAGLMATAYSIVKNEDRNFKEIKEILEKEGVQELVLGYSVDLQGKENTVQKHIDAFKKLAEDEWEMKVHMQTELFSSMQAKWGVTKSVRRIIKQDRTSQKTKTPKHIDAGAAVVILQSFLDTNQA